jgi:hypothetical protein
VKKLSVRYHKYALPICTTFFMTFLVSGVATYRVLGWDVKMVDNWMVSWAISWAVAAPTMYFVMPLVRRTLDRFIEK